MAKPSPEELRYRLKFRIVDMIGSTIHTIVPWGCAVLIAWIFYKSVLSLAGQYTFAQIGIRFLGDLRVSDSVAYIFGARGVVYGLKRRKLLRDNIERTANRIADLEKRLDIKRSSSRLTPRGTTRPGDEQ